MAKNKNKSPKENSKKDVNYYKLNTEAVDRLVNAEKIAAEKKTTLNDPAKQYRSGILDRIPAPVKACFVKFWFGGAVCYFIFCGMVTDMLTNNALRFVETLPGENEKWMMFPKRKFWTFFANIFYAFIVLFCVVWLYEAINGIANTIKGTENLVYIGVEPILFGMFYLLFDIIFINLKNLLRSIFNDAKKVNKQ